MGLIRIAAGIRHPIGRGAEQGKPKSQAPAGLPCDQDDGRRIEHEAVQFPAGHMVHPPDQPDEDQRLKQHKPRWLTLNWFAEEHRPKNNQTDGNGQG